MNQMNDGEPAGGLTDDSPIDELDERLVAYLDGELDPDDRKQLEIQLGRNADLRARLRTLQDGWELLDDLPMAAPSAVLLESTLRMAATEATWNSKSGTPGAPRRPGSVKRWLTSRPILVLMLSVIGFAGGALAARVNDYVRFQHQLRQLSIAMHVEAYFHAADLELMRSLMQMPQWQQAVAIAEQFGEWDFSVQRTIDQATPTQRQKILPELPIESQQKVTEAWQRFENLGAKETQAVLSAAARVASQSDAEQLLATMDRYAIWRQSLPPAERAKIEGADSEERTKAITEAIERTTRQWTQQTARVLSDEDSEAIYQALREIARARINSLQLDDLGLPDQTRRTLETFGSEHQVMKSREEPYFLRRLFEPYDSGSPREYSFFAPNFPSFLPFFEQRQGPLDNLELRFIEAALGDTSAAAIFVADAAQIESLREDVLRIWAEGVIRRMSSRRTGTTLSERYQLIDPARRDLLDLLEPDKILEWLQNEGRGRRSFQ